MTFRTWHSRPEGNEDQQGQDIYHEGFIAVSVVPSGPRIPLHVRCLPVIGGYCDRFRNEGESFQRGRERHAVVCGACHQPHGRGQEGLAPPLLDSEWSIGNEHRLIRIALQGVRDPLVVNGVTSNLAMPAFAEVLKDEQIADLLTYIRHEWGHSAPAVKPETVQQVREATTDREYSWTEAELLPPHPQLVAPKNILRIGLDCAYRWRTVI